MYLSFRSAILDVIEKDIDFAAFSGDLFHNKNVDARALSDAENALDEFQKENVPVVGIQGNHDAQLYRKDLNWLEYLHQRKKMVLLEANLRGEGEIYSPHDPDNPGNSSGFVEIGGARIFGLQYLGRRITDYVDNIAEEIRKIEEERGEPEITVLLAHFGVSGNVPGMSGGVEYSSLEPLQPVVDYLGLGHYHKKYTHGDWVFNPGSCEAHDTREARWKHGYYIVEQNSGEKQVEFNPTKRRPFFDVRVEVDGSQSPEELSSKVMDEVESSKPSLRKKQNKGKYMARGEIRKPVINLELNGLLQFSRSDLDSEQIREEVAETTGALYVNLVDRTETKETAGILQDLDQNGEELKDEDGNLNRGELEKAVFHRIAGKDSRYKNKREKVAETMKGAKSEIENDSSPENIAESLKKTRRELFPSEKENES